VLSRVTRGGEKGGRKREIAGPSATRCSAARLQKKKEKRSPPTSVLFTATRSSPRGKGGKRKKKEKKREMLATSLGGGRGGKDSRVMVVPSKKGREGRGKKKERRGCQSGRQDEGKGGEKEKIPPSFATRLPSAHDRGEKKKKGGKREITISLWAEKRGGGRKGGRGKIPSLTLPSPLVTKKEEGGGGGERGGAIHLFLSTLPSRKEKKEGLYPLLSSCVVL